MADEEVREVDEVVDEVTQIWLEQLLLLLLLPPPSPPALMPMSLSALDDPFAPTPAAEPELVGVGSLRSEKQSRLPMRLVSKGLAPLASTVYPSCSLNKRPTRGSRARRWSDVAAESLQSGSPQSLPAAARPLHRPRLPHRPCLA